MLLPSPHLHLFSDIELMPKCFNTETPCPKNKREIIFIFVLQPCVDVLACLTSRPTVRRLMMDSSSETKVTASFLPGNSSYDETQRDTCQKIPPKGPGEYSTISLILYRIKSHVLYR